MQGYQTRKNRRKKQQQKKLLLLAVILVMGCIITGLAIYFLTRTNSKTDSPAPTQTPEATQIPEATLAPELPSDKLSTVKPVSSSSPTINKALFDDAVFIGDSRTEGLQLATGLKNATFLTQRGLTVSTAMTEKVIPLKNGKKGTIIDALSEKQYRQVFVMFGVNELGWPYTTTFEQKYKSLLAEIQKVQPNAKIYVQSIIPVTKEKSDNSDIYNNKNIKKFNKSIVALTKEMGLTYLDVKQAVVDNNNILPSDASPDGVHLNNKYCKKWLSYIEQAIQ